MTADNYISWKSLQRSAMQYLGIWDHVEGNSPTDPVIPPAGPSAALDEWKKKDAIALAQIKFNISSNQMYNTGDQDVTKTAYEVWDALRKVYTNTSTAAKMALRNQFSAYRFDPSTSVRDHSNGLRVLGDKLRACGETVSETDLSYYDPCRPRLHM